MGPVRTGPPSTSGRKTAGVGAQYKTGADRRQQARAKTPKAQGICRGRKSARSRRNRKAPPQPTKENTLKGMGLKTRPQKRICPKQFSSAPDEKLDCLALLTMR